jgi:hypothetical protein
MSKYFHDVKVGFSSRNLPGFQHEALCSCGWNAKVDTEVDAVSASDRHIKANGGGHYTVDLAMRPVAKAKEPTLIRDDAHPKLEPVKPEIPKTPREAVLAKGDEIKDNTGSPVERAEEAKAEPKTPPVVPSFNPAKTVESKPAPPVQPISPTVGGRKLGQV